MEYNIPNPSPANPMLPPPASGRLAPVPETPKVVISTKAADLSAGRKFKVATIVTGLFIILSHQYIYKATNTVFTYIFSKGSGLGDDNHPTFTLVLVHAALFFVATMYLLFRT